MLIEIQPNSAAVLATTTVVLFLKGVALSYLQVRMRVLNRSFERPEDARLMGVAPQPEPEGVNRIGDAWRNEHENTPPFLAMACGYVQLGGASAPLCWVCGVYCVMRLAHAYAQIATLQPHRTVSFISGLAAATVLAGLTLVLVLGAAS
jgi:microsomal prostaglandin-E synthase 1